MILDGNSVTIEDCHRVLHGEKVEIADSARANIIASRKSVERIIEEKKVVYGITTGFGLFCDVHIEPSKNRELQVNLIRSHATSVGKPFEKDIVRMMLLLRANALAKGYSGVREIIIERLLFYLNNDIIPVVPSQGSLGASGDLAPLAHLALTLIGEGEVEYKDKVVPTIDVLNELNIEPLVLEAKEGLGLINGTQAMTAVGVLAWIISNRLLKEAEFISTLTFQALQGIIETFEPEQHIARGYPEQIKVAEDYLEILKDSKLTTHQGELRVQDAYSLRCIPQVIGAIRRAMSYTKDTIDIEINAATDNPLIFNNGEKVISGGNFHGEPVAFAMDFLKIPLSELANIAERRIERLVNPNLNNGLPAFLANEEGIESGAMILQYVAASLVSENKVLAHPASVDSIPSSANQEDHVSMGTTAARQALEIVRNTEHVLAIECFTAAQAIHFRGPELLSPKTKAFYDEYRKRVPHYETDRIFANDINATKDFLLEWFS